MIELTKLCSTGGCAAKYDAPLLGLLLAALPHDSPPDLLVGLDPPDDAAVIRLGDELGLVFSVDFFPPVVDEPHTYGRIAANNAMNDIYAMGGRPVLALSIAAFPSELPAEVVSSIVRGAAEQCAAAGAVLAGGHTIRDREPKFGLAVAGTVLPERIWKKSGAQPGDRVLLTKPLGTGLLVTGRRRNVISDEDFENATTWMLRSSGQVPELLADMPPHAVTDITGFGLAGHASEVARLSDVRMVIDMAKVPVLDGAKRCAQEGIRTSAHAANVALIDDVLEVATSVDESTVALSVDPQTAGGLLIVIPARAAAEVSDRLTRGGQLVADVGEVTHGQGIRLLHSA